MTSYTDYLPTVKFQDTLSLSPDGRHIAYVDDASGQFNVVAQDVAVAGEGRRITSYTDSAVQRVCWYPDGRSILFLADTKGNEHAQIFRVDVKGGDVAALTDTPSAEYVLATENPFSPDATKLLYAGNDRSPVDQDVLVRDLNTGEVRRVYAGGGRVIPGGWSPDGTQVSVVKRRGGVTDHVVSVVGVEDGRVVRLTPEDGPAAAYWLGPWLPDGTGILVASDAGRDFTALGVLDTRTGDLSWFDTPVWDVDEAVLSGDGRVLVWSVNVDGTSEPRARELSTGTELSVPAFPGGVISGLDVSADGRIIAMLMSTPDRPTNVAILDLASGTLRWLTDSRAGGANPASFVTPALVRYPARDGRQIPAYVYRPRSTTGRTPVVLAIHGGPPAQERPLYSLDGLFQYLAGEGVAVFAPNVRGSTGYGKAYQELSYRDWGGGDLGDFADAVHYLRQQSWVDPERIGLYGRSYGGFAVLSCVSRLPELDWAAAVDWCGPSNLVTFTRSNPPTWRSKVAFMVGDPDRDEAFLRSRSPVTYADQIRAPLFVIQGANDPRVPQPESDQIVERLRARGVEVRYDVYPDEGHAFSKRENRIKAQSDAADFLLARLAT